MENALSEETAHGGIESALCDDPPDPRLEVTGAVVDSRTGAVNVSAYLDLKRHFACEGPRERHPNPQNPGVRAEEADDLEGLRWWCDAKGAGWIASRDTKKGEPKQSKWFSKNKLGSWRLAFILARLQREIWQADRSSEMSPEPKVRTVEPAADRSRSRGRADDATHAKRHSSERRSRLRSKVSLADVPDRNVGNCEPRFRLRRKVSLPNVPARDAVAALTPDSKTRESRDCPSTTKLAGKGPPTAEKNVAQRETRVTTYTRYKVMSATDQRIMRSQRASKDKESEVAGEVWDPDGLVVPPTGPDVAIPLDLGAKPDPNEGSKFDKLDNIVAPPGGDRRVQPCTYIGRPLVEHPAEVARALNRLLGIGTSKTTPSD